MIGWATIARVALDRRTWATAGAAALVALLLLALDQRDRARELADSRPSPRRAAMLGRWDRAGPRGLGFWVTRKGYGPPRQRSGCRRPLRR